MKVLAEYVFQKELTDLETLNPPRDSVELATGTFTQFDNLLPLFTTSGAPVEVTEEPGATLLPHDIIKKAVNPNIVLTNVSVAYWFAGDGGRSDYTTNNGKGIDFATHGFNRESVEILCNALNTQFNYQATVMTSSRGQYFIRLSGTSYDMFVENIGPYLTPYVACKLPRPRSNKSRHGHMTKARFDQVIPGAFGPSSVVNETSGSYIDTWSE